MGAISTKSPKGSTFVSPRHLRHQAQKSANGSLMTAEFPDAIIYRGDWKCRTRKCKTKRFRFFAVKSCLLYRDLIIVSVSLYINISSEALMLRTCRLAHLSVCVSVCLSGKCIVAKRLNGSGCHLRWWVGSVEKWVYWMGVVIVEGEGAIFLLCCK